MGFRGKGQGLTSGQVPRMEQGSCPRHDPSLSSGRNALVTKLAAGRGRDWLLAHWSAGKCHLLLAHWSAEMCHRGTLAVRGENESPLVRTPHNGPPAPRGGSSDWLAACLGRPLLPRPQAGYLAPWNGALPSPPLFPIGCCGGRRHLMTREAPSPAARAPCGGT